MKKIGFVLAIASLMLAVLFVMCGAPVSAKASSPHVAIGGGFDTLIMTTTQAMGDEVVHYYLSGQPYTMTVGWKEIASGSYQAEMTGTSRWESIKVDDILSAEVDSSFWKLASGGWIERIPLSPELGVGGSEDLTIVLTSTYGYGDEAVYVGGLVAGQVVSQTLDWNFVSDGVYTVSIDVASWQSFKVGYNRPQQVTITNPYWQSGTDGWVERSDYIPPMTVSHIFLPVTLNMRSPVIAVAPVGFCKGTEGWVIPTAATPQDPQCSAGTYVVDLQGQQTTYDTFLKAVHYIDGREATFWYRPASW